MFGLVMADENKDKTRYCVHVEPKKKIITGEKFQFHRCKIKEFMGRKDNGCIGSFYTNDDQYELVAYDTCRAESCPLFTTDCEGGERANLAVKLMAK